MARRLPSVLVLLLSCLPANAVRAETENTTEYRERLVAEKKYPEALQAYKDALAKDPNNPVLMYNAGLMAYFCEKPKEAAGFWSREKAIEPNDWRVRAKLVQAYEAAGNFKQRDAEREDLFKLRRESADKELKNLEYYCRDQFSVGKNRVMVFEENLRAFSAGLHKALRFIAGKGEAWAHRTGQTRSGYWCGPHSTERVCSQT